MIFIALPLSGSIENTKHNLSSSGSGNIVAVGETEICVFCHTPHHAQVGRPLWNRATPTGDYAYASEYMSRANYPEIGNLGVDSSEPGGISRQCLSCHDGTIAIGSVYILRGSLLGNAVIDMSGLTSGDSLSSGDMGFLGTDLSTHHPVGVKYSPNIIIPFGDGSSKTLELKSTPTGSVKLFSYSSGQYVECSSCHNPHSENKKFLRDQAGATHGVKIVNLCNSCHDKKNWEGSTHESTSKLYSDNGIDAKYGTKSIADLGCINCHTPHNSASSPSLLRGVEENTCFKGAASGTNTANCHGIGGAKDIESMLLRAYSHPVLDQSKEGKHTNLDSLYGTGVPRDPVGSSGLNWGDSKHAECVDCHNQHEVRAGTHAPADQWYPNTPTNLVSNVLKGVSGVEPVWTPRWTQPTSFTTLSRSKKEYQICFKCHSYWGLGVANEGSSQYLIESEGVVATDQAFEFNPNNRSGHPVVVSLNSRPGSYPPKALRADELRPPWNVSPGNNLMYCSDCHGADNEDSTDPKGPHGSNANFMLKGPNKFWPTLPNGDLIRLQDINTQTGSGGIFCMNCHDLRKSPIHIAKLNLGYDFACVNCHVAIPHGSPVSRLIGYRSFPAPYNYNGNSLGLDGFRKNSDMDNKHDNAYQRATGGGFTPPPSPGCNCHQSYRGFYDTYP